MFLLSTLLGNVVLAKVHDSVIIRNSMIAGSKNVSGHTMTFKTALKAVGKNSKSTGSKIISQLCKIQGCSMNYMKDFTDLKEYKQQQCETVCQKDTKAGRFLSSRSAWDRVVQVWLEW